MSNEIDYPTDNERAADAENVSALGSLAGSGEKTSGAYPRLTIITRRNFPSILSPISVYLKAI